MLTVNKFNKFYPDLAFFSAASTSGAYYYRNQNGKRVRVKKGKNRLNVYSGKKVKRIVGRVGFKVKNDEYYGKAVLSKDRTKSIKQNPGLLITAKDDYVKATGRVNNLKGGVAVGRKRGKKIDAIAYGRSIDLIEFNNNSTYTRTSSSGKKHIVKKGKRKKLKTGLKVAGTLAGLGLLTYLGLKGSKNLSKQLSKRKYNPDLDPAKEVAKDYYEMEKNIRKKTKPISDDIDRFFGKS